MIRTDRAGVKLNYLWEISCQLLYISFIAQIKLKSYEVFN